MASSNRCEVVMRATDFQRHNDPLLDRKDHIWWHNGIVWKCVLCGGISKAPPQYPTPPRWMPDRYERLSVAERGLVPVKA